MNPSNSSKQPFIDKRNFATPRSYSALWAQGIQLLLTSAIYQGSGFFCVFNSQNLPSQSSQSFRHASLFLLSRPSRQFFLHRWLAQKLLIFSRLSFLRQSLRNRSTLGGLSSSICDAILYNNQKQSNIQIFAPKLGLNSEIGGSQKPEKPFSKILQSNIYRIPPFMEKLCWKTVKHNEKTGHMPNLRWGHSCAIVEDEVVFFGGYADSNYMNDLWSFNTITMEWNEITTTGDIPSHRSNCTMHYDKDNDQLVLFGGGGPNKQRFNTISLLNWKTKEWIQISPKTIEPALWARTYHSSELFYPYLVVYGGEGISDLDDLWVFNFITMNWTEVPVPANSARPCARRFHSSAKIGNQFFIIAGCHAKYRCLSDIYSIDLTKLIETGSVENLQWRQRKMKDNTFLTRWGHTSTVYDDKIYVFGGRFCNDLNDILILDPARDQITTAKIQGEVPKARRRHSACFLGSSMLIFGGFNGEYFNDLHYINITQPKKKFFVNCSFSTQAISGLEKNKILEWYNITSKQGNKHKVCKGLISSRFTSEQSLENFLNGIEEELQDEDLNKLIHALSNGYGNIDSQLIYQYGIKICESKFQMEQEIRKSIDCEQRQSIIGNRRPKSIDSIIALEDMAFRQYIERRRNEQIYQDVVFVLQNDCQVKANRALLSLGSQYFKVLVSGKYLEKDTRIPIPFNDSVLFQVLVHYLSSGFLVFSKEYGHQFWVMLAEMAQYYTLNSLLAICQQQLVSRITEYTCQELLIIALEISMPILANSCAEQIIRNMINQQKEETNQIFPEVKSEDISLQREQVLKEVYGTLRFDILQKKIQSEEKEARNSLKLFDKANVQNAQEEKQNNEISH